MHLLTANLSPDMIGLLYVRLYARAVFKVGVYGFKPPPEMLDFFFIVQIG